MSPPSSSPYTIDEAKSHCIKLLTQSLPSLSSPKISPSSKLTLHRLLASELRFLLSNPEPGSLNLGYLDSLLLCVLHPSVLHVSRVSTKPISSAHVDLVCTFSRSPAWLLVSDRNPRFVSWPHIRLRLLNTLASAHSSPALKPSIILFLFRRGLPEGVSGSLIREFGAAEFEFSGFHRAFRINVGADNGRAVAGEVLKGLEVGEQRGFGDEGGEFGKLVLAMRVDDGGEEVELVNFDTTALVAVVSGISNCAGERLLAAPEDEMRERFKSNYKFVIEQVIPESLAAL